MTGLRNLFDANAEVIVIAHADHTELRLPNVGEPVMLRPGDRREIWFGMSVSESPLPAEEAS